MTSCVSAELLSGLLFAQLRWTKLVIAIALVAVPAAGHANSEDTTTEAFRHLSYGAKGVEFRTRGDSTFLWFGVRLQPRYSDLQGTPVEPSELASQEVEEAEFNRGRLKLGGHLFREWADVYTEYSIVTGTLLDYRATLTSPGGLDLRFGQGKTVYNRERVDSSGAQQFAERSISNYWFTVDRQQGVALSGRIGAGKWFDSSLWFPR